MRELFPVVAGAVIGGLVMLISSQRLRVTAFVIGCLILGVVASWTSGELTESWAFFTVDAALVWLGGLVVVVGLTTIRYGRLRFFTKTPNQPKK